MSEKRQDKFERAKDYLLAHPDATKAQAAVALGVSQSTIAQARAELIALGKLAPSRKGDPIQPREPQTPRAPSQEAAPADQAAKMLDHAAMQALADMIDGLDDMDDEEVIKRLLKQCLKFAFDPTLHPDTRMSASQMWAKLRDQGKAKNLGPGAPKTFEDAVARHRDLDAACGPKIAAAAIANAFAGPLMEEFLVRVFTIVGANPVLAAVGAVFQEVSDGEAADDETPAPVGTPQAPGPAGHPSGDPAPEVVRSLDVGVGGRPAEDGQQDHDLPGPAA